MKTNAPTYALLNDGRLHLQHGPIDLIIEAIADDQREIALAYKQASMRFSGLLANLALELKQLRTPLFDHFPLFVDPIAQRMGRAVWPYRDEFITPMAAVAGAVADEMLQALTAGRILRRAYVNNGGDIAIHLAPGEEFSVGISGIEDARVKGKFTICVDDNARGVATSGWRGRSFSLGIADSVTTLARTAAEADAAATMIANAVRIEHPDIERVPACDLQPESDLGTLPVTRGVPMLDCEKIQQALDAGEFAAHKFIDAALLERAAIRLQGQVRIVSTSSFQPRKGDKPRRESSVVLSDLEISSLVQS